MFGDDDLRIEQMHAVGGHLWRRTDHEPKRRTLMNKDRVEGKVKDIAGRVERQAGEWTDDPEKQVKGTAKQVEGKTQNAWGKAKDAAKDTDSKPPRTVPDESDDEASSRRA
jgi:uncharacterized protein YjbJ (UPF0337 family)